MRIMALMLLLVLLFSREVSSTSVSRTTEGLTRFPHDISSSATEIDLDDNSIEHIDYLETFASLEVLSIAKNLLTEFPNLFNVSSTLKCLFLNENRISYISPAYLDQLSVLEELYLISNQLDQIPDVSGPSNTLTFIDVTDNLLTKFPHFSLMGGNLDTIHISDNLISEITLQQLHQTPKLDKLAVMNTPIKSLPNICLLNNTEKAGLFRWTFGGNQLMCDQSMAWFTVALGRGLTTYDSQPSCSQPAAVAGTTPDVVPINNMLTTRDTIQFHQRHFHQLDSPQSLQCYPTITEVYRQMSAVSCAGVCATADDCMAYAVDGGDCVISEASTAGTAADFLRYQNWYLIK